MDIYDQCCSMQPSAAQDSAYETLFCLDPSVLLTYKGLQDTPCWLLEVTLTAWRIQVHPNEYIKAIWRLLTSQEAVLSCWHMQCWFFSADPTLMNSRVLFYLFMLWPTWHIYFQLFRLSWCFTDPVQPRYKRLGASSLKLAVRQSFPFL